MVRVSIGNLVGFTKQSTSHVLEQLNYFGELVSLGSLIEPQAYYKR